MEANEEDIKTFRDIEYDELNKQLTNRSRSRITNKMENRKIEHTENRKMEI